MSVNPLPQPQALTIKGGGISMAGYQFLQSLYQGAVKALTDVGNVQTQLSTQVEGFSFSFTYPEAKRYDVWLKSPFALTITESTSFCQSGSCTAQIQVNTANQGTSHAVSGSNVTHTQSITVNAGDTINIAISSVSSCQDMSFSMKWVRA